MSMIAVTLPELRFVAIPLASRARYAGDRFSVVRREGGHCAWSHHRLRDR
jgi:hypothetical protein